MRKPAFALASLAVGLLTGVVSVGSPASAQQGCSGLAVGCTVKWVMGPPSGASEWRAGHYSGVITEVMSGIAGAAQPPRTVLIDLVTGKSTTINMDRISAVRCRPETWRTVPALGHKVRVCTFRGGGIDGERGVDYIGSLRVKFDREIVLANGQHATSFNSGFDGYHDLSMGSGPNDFAVGATPQQPHPQPQPQPNPQPHPQPPTPPQPPQGAIQVPEIGQPFAQALTVHYPAIVQATMGAQDYDTVLFDFPGGRFQARAASALNLVIDLLDANGKPLSRSFGQGGLFDMNLAPGRYGLIVRVMNHGGTGPYELTIGPAGGASTRYHERQ